MALWRVRDDIAVMNLCGDANENVKRFTCDIVKRNFSSLENP